MPALHFEWSFEFGSIVASGRTPPSKGHVGSRVAEKSRFVRLEVAEEQIRDTRRAEFPPICLCAPRLHFRETAESDAYVPVWSTGSHCPAAPRRFGFEPSGFPI